MYKSYSYDGDTLLVHGIGHINEDLEIDLNDLDIFTMEDKFPLLYDDHHLQCDVRMEYADYDRDKEEFIMKTTWALNMYDDDGNRRDDVPELKNARGEYNEYRTPIKDFLEMLTEPDTFFMFTDKFNEFYAPVFNRIYEDVEKNGHVCAESRYDKLVSRNPVIYYNRGKPLFGVVGTRQKDTYFTNVFNDKEPIMKGSFEQFKEIAKKIADAKENGTEADESLIAKIFIPQSGEALICDVKDAVFHTTGRCNIIPLFDHKEAIPVEEKINIEEYIDKVFKDYQKEIKQKLSSVPEISVDTEGLNFDDEISIDF